MEVQKIKTTEEDRRLVSVFMGEEYPIEVDFNWLMPSWEKFSKLQFNDSSITAIHLNYCARITHALAASDIYTAHKFLVNGIQWYTQNHQ